MSCLALKNSTLVIIPVGTLLVQSAPGSIRQYDPENDSLDDIIGTAYATERTSGRDILQTSGVDYYLNDSIIWSEKLMYDVDESNNPLENPEYTPFNPYNDRVNYTIVLHTGLGPVLNTYSSVPPRWFLLREGVTYSWYLVR